MFFLKIKRDASESSVPVASIKDALPLGTVIAVHQRQDQKYMIVGYATDITPYAYYVLPWPQGFASGDDLCLVERNEISAVILPGARTEESVLFMIALDQVLKGEF